MQEQIGKKSYFEGYVSGLWLSIHDGYKCWSLLLFDLDNLSWKKAYFKISNAKKGLTFLKLFFPKICFEKCKWLE